ncbi:lysozyme inhibitor LprI family protein [Xanthomonas campestris pv. phormiicola]|nr:lysozyme inhibitor LprI family protein [Xanthomonas campestris pv. phormiicola]UYC17518.1 lysozyme inhibitor LprI family protein [Xanthomonas campestris pv. phormiicola]
MDKRRGFCASVFALALALAWMPTAAAVSFDCAKASSAVERLLCTDPRLDAADEWLARRYAALLAVVPAAQRQGVRSAQQAWLAQRDDCLSQPDPGACLKQRIETRVRALDSQFAPQAARFDRIVAGIPAAPAAAATHLRAYDGGLASAWLVYLHRFVPAAGVGAAEARARFASASAALRQQDGVAGGLLDTAEPASRQAGEARDLTLLRLWIERSGYTLDAATQPNPRPYVHCFVFAQQGQAAYDAMGPLYGSSRDLSAPICRPLPGLFDQPAWTQLQQAFRSLVDRVSDDAGTMRYADFAAWRVLSLQATVSPLLLLKQPQGAEPPGDPAAAIAAWHDASLWPQADRKAALAALQPAREVSARWMVEHASLPPAQAGQVAAALVAEWVEARIAFGKGPEG